MLRPIDDLLSNSVIFGAEKKVVNMKEVLGVAVIMARPQEPFLLMWRKEMHKNFDGDRCYACHSILLGTIFSADSLLRIYLNECVIV